MQNFETMLTNCIKNRDQMDQPLINLRRLMKENGTEGYLKLCRRRIIEASPADLDNIRMDISDPENLMLTTEAIKQHKDILEGYIDAECLQKTMEDMHYLEKIFKCINDQSNMFRLLDRPTLRAIAKGINAANISPDTMDKLQALAKEELKARRFYRKAARKIAQTLDKIKAIWHYRRLYLGLFFRPEMIDKTDSKSS